MEILELNAINNSLKMDENNNEINTNEKIMKKKTCIICGLEKLRNEFVIANYYKETTIMKNKCKNCYNNVSKIYYNNKKVVLLEKQKIKKIEKRKKYNIMMKFNNMDELLIQFELIKNKLENDKLETKTRKEYVKKKII